LCTIPAFLSLKKAQNKSKATPCSTFARQMSIQKRNWESNPQFDVLFFFLKDKEKKKVRMLRDILKEAKGLSYQ
jgi:hypothetical protein